MLTKLELLKKNPSKTCFVLKGDKIIFSSSAKGVKPLKDFYEEYGSFANLIVVDKIMGKGAVILADLIGAKEIYTPIISEIALNYAKSKKINTYFEKAVPYIINREKNGGCPIETSVININNSKEGYKIIDLTLKKLRGE